MKRLFVVSLMLVLVLALVGCAIVDVPEQDELVSPARLVLSVPASAVQAEESAAALPPATIAALAVIVVVLALANERLVEAFIKVGWIKQDGQAATWQSVFGALAIAALALAKYLGLENQVTAPVNALVDGATAFALLIPIFGQAGVAKLAHEGWKLIGWVTQANQVKQLALNAAIDRG